MVEGVCTKCGAAYPTTEAQLAAALANGGYVQLVDGEAVISGTWLHGSGLDYWDVDLVFSGHTHGGQFRIPVVGSLYGLDMGFFPGWLEGEIPSEDGSKHLILSRGLGNSLPVPRLNNPPQVLVVDVVAK